MKTSTKNLIRVIVLWFFLILLAFAVALGTGCSTTGSGKVTGTRTPMYVVTNYTSSVTTTGTNVSSVVNTQVQSFIKPQRRYSLLGLLIGEKDPISTSVPSGQSVQQGHPEPPVVVSPSYPYGYGGGYGGYGYGSPYRSMYSGYGSSEKRLFGYRFHSR